MCIQPTLLYTKTLKYSVIVLWVGVVSFGCSSRNNHHRVCEDRGVEYAGISVPDVKMILKDDMGCIRLVIKDRQIAMEWSRDL